MKHPCYMEDGSIINAYTGCIIEEPAILVDRETGTIHGYGNLENVKAKFEKFTAAARATGNETVKTNLIDPLMLIELNGYRISREDACYIIRRAVEFSGTNFLTEFCNELLHGSDPIAWLNIQKEKIPIDIYEKEWKTR